MTDQFAFSDHIFDKEIIDGLRKNLLSLYKNDDMDPAGIGNKFAYTKNLKIRGDLIHWLNEDSDNLFEKQFFSIINSFIQHLNRTCFTGIKDKEFHYAMYETGSFYKRHLDQFKSDSGRKYSFVLYLNDNWQDDEGGEILIYNGEDERKYLPLGGRCVFFKSDEIEHEVLKASRDRLSIAGWLKV